MKLREARDDEGLTFPWDADGVPSTGAPAPTGKTGKGGQPTLEEYFEFLEMFPVTEEELRHCKVFPQRFSLEP